MVRERADRLLGGRTEETGGLPSGISRRAVAQAVAAGAIAAAIGVPRPALAQTRAPQAAGNPPPLQVGALVYPRMILLDLVGPQTVFSLMRANVHLVGKDRSSVPTDAGIPIAPTTTIAECPADLDVLFVPGGLEGTVAAMGDPAFVDFLADRGSRAKLVTSVCTGSLLLGAAGLLRGYAATSHWYVRDLLPALGAVPKAERVVVDRNRITGGGVTAGIDFGFELARQLRGGETARLFELVLEYDPKPPFASGTPEQASVALTDRVRQIRSPAITAAEDAVARAAQRLKI